MAENLTNIPETLKIVGTRRGSLDSLFSISRDPWHMVAPGCRQVPSGVLVRIVEGKSKNRGVVEHCHGPLGTTTKKTVVLRDHLRCNRNHWRLELMRLDACPPKGQGKGIENRKRLVKIGQWTVLFLYPLYTFGHFLLAPLSFLPWRRRTQ